MPRFVDSHAHLFYEDYRADFDAVLMRAAESGVEAIVCPGTNARTSAEAVTIAERHDAVRAAVGIHPHEASSADESAWTSIATLSTHPRVVAIGEIGLDYHYDFSPPEMQRSVFRRQLELARERRLPVIIHSREAESDTIGIVEDAVRTDPSWRGRPGAEPAARGVFHCFPGDEAMARKVIDLGFYISFPGPLTFPEKPARPNVMAAVARTAPLDRVLIETDSPYLTPHPHRGRRNEPANVALVAARLSELRGKTLEEIGETTTANARHLFGF